LVPDPIPKPIIDLSFPYRWQAEILAARPLILPTRHFVYPRAADEVERGALEVMIRPEARNATTFSRHLRAGISRSGRSHGPLVYSKPEEICAVAGGYAYLIDTTAPERFTMIPYRPVLEVRAAVARKPAALRWPSFDSRVGAERAGVGVGEAFRRRRDDCRHRRRRCCAGRVGDEERPRKTFYARPADWLAASVARNSVSLTFSIGSRALFASRESSARMPRRHLQTPNPSSR
jgi:hypothetical protein